MIFKFSDFKKSFPIIFILTFIVLNIEAQNVKWSKDGNSYTRVESGQIVQYALPGQTKTTLVGAENLTPAGTSAPIAFRDYSFSEDGQKILIFTNAKRVWRYPTRGDYWVYDRTTQALTQLGKGRPSSSLMFAKFSPDGQKVAYVSEHNLYVENLSDGSIRALTQTNGTKKLINGTFDWVYEEEFDCRDGFHWSPDSKKIAYWQIDANKVKDYLMINTTDSTYPRAVPVEYPVVGENPSPYQIGVADVSTGSNVWMNIPGDHENTYLPRMDWAANSDQLIVEQLNRKQNESTLMLCNAMTGAANPIYQEKNAAWIDAPPVETFGEMKAWDWINGGKDFIWVSEKDGWRHIYRISRDGKKETLITKGDFDIVDKLEVDEKGGYVYFTASPNNATQRYLYRQKLDGAGKPELMSPAAEKGNHHYSISPNGRYAQHYFSNYYTPRQGEMVSLPDHKPLDASKDILSKIQTMAPADSKLSFFQVKTVDGVTLDGWMVKPANFDSTKKYPIVFEVYTEPAATTVNDEEGAGENRLYLGDMAQDGYIYVSLDGRGTPSPKGAAWRKAIYRKIGTVNIRDQAMGATEMFKRWPWIDTSRVAVWGWSGGGSTTLNCMFQYPDIYKTGIAVAAVADFLTYDNIYEERYMGIPQENKEDFVNGSPITYAKNLRGNLLYIHGTGDDNVHYKNAEELQNELIKYNKQFQFMSYPNRTHGIFEGAGTRLHLATLYTQYLREHCAPGGR